MKKTISVICTLVLILSCLLDIYWFIGSSTIVTTFGDGDSEKTISFPWGGGTNQSTYIEIPNKAKISNAYFNVTTVYSAVGNYPNAPYIDVGGDGDIEWAFQGIGYGDYGRQNVFSNNMLGQSVNFDANKTFENQVKIIMPKNATVSTATMKVRGSGSGKVLLVTDGESGYGITLMINALKRIGNSVTTATETTLPINWNDPKEFKVIFWIGGISSSNGPSNSLLNPLINYVKTGGSVFMCGSWIDYTGVYSGTYEIPFFEWVLHNTWGNRWNGGGSGIGTSNKYTKPSNSSHPVFTTPHSLPSYWGNLYTGTFWHTPSLTINNGTVIGKVDTTTSNPRYNAIIAWDGPAYNPAYGRTLMVRQPIARSWFNITQGDVLSQFTENVASWFIGQGEVANVTVNIGDNGGIPEFEHSGRLDDCRNISDFKGELNSLISTLPVAFIDDYGIQFVEVPINITADGPGSLLLSDMNIQYSLIQTAILNPHNFTLANELNELVPDTGEGNISIPFKIFSGSAGALNIRDIFIDYTMPALTNDLLLLLDGHGPNNICYADYKNYTFMVNITNKAGVDDVNNVTLILDPEGECIKILWTENTQTFTELSDPKDLIILDIPNCHSNIPSSSRWSLLFSIRFNWAYPQETLELCAIQTTNDTGANVFDYFADVYRVENDLDLIGTLDVVSQYQGILIDNGEDNWVRSNEIITWSNLTAVYEGTIDIYPDNKNFNITIRDDDNGIWVNRTRSGKAFTITTVSDPDSDYSDIHSIDITDIPGCGEDVSNWTFLIKTDNDGPQPPPGMVCHADSPYDPETTADDDNIVYVIWLDTIDQGGSGVKDYAMELNNDKPTTIKSSGVSMRCPEGKVTFFVRAIDNVGNWGISASASIFIDLTDITFSSPTPSDEIWHVRKTVECGILIQDIGGSGVLESSIQYRYVDSGPIETCAWNSYSGAASEESVLCRQNITFQEDGCDKKVQWRAKDRAGNGFVLSDIYELKIDSLSVIFDNFSIDFDKWYNTLTPGIEFMVSDKNPNGGSSSGVDVSNIMYSYSTSGLNNYGQWYGIVGTPEEDSIKCSISQTFVEGDQNYIRFTAKDIAGNEILSDDYNLKIDIMKPSFSNPKPELSFWNNITQIQCGISIFDGQSKINIDSIRYSISTSGPDNFGKWCKVNLKYYNQTEYTNLIIEVNETFNEGMDNYIRWLAYDNAGNFIISDNYPVLIDITGCTFHNPIPQQEWINNLDVVCGIIINDSFGSGVNITTIEYAISNDGIDNFRKWTNKNLEIVKLNYSYQTQTRSDDLIKSNPVSVQALVFVDIFYEGEENYIIWRAKDVAGNSYTLGGPYKVNIDLSPLDFFNPIPKPDIMQYDLNHQCQITIKDIGGSGVNPISIEFRSSINGKSDFSPWKSSGISYSKNRDNYRFLISSTFYPGKANYMQWRCKDNAGNGPFESEQFRIIINSPPVPIISYPKLTEDYYEKENITFDSLKSTDPDPEDSLIFYWESNISGFLSNYPHFKENLMPGMHNITLYVSDGHNHNISTFIIINVKRLDMDNDEIPDIYDLDLDGDGYLNTVDAFPRNKREWLDTDYDGEGNNVDSDDDNDGYPDDVDDYPLDKNRWEKGTKIFNSGIVIFLFILIFLIILTILTIFILIKRRAKKTNTTNEQSKRPVTETEVQTPAQVSFNNAPLMTMQPSPYQVSMPIQTLTPCLPPYGQYIASQTNANICPTQPGFYYGPYMATQAGIIPIQALPAIPLRKKI